MFCKNIETERIPFQCADFITVYDRTGDGARAAQESGLPVLTAGAPLGYYVYGLLSSIGDVFYVGKGSKRRWLQHYSQRLSDKSNPRKLKRIFEVGTTPACVIFAQGLLEQDAFELESALIKRLPELTNLKPGQRSERERNKLLAQMSLESLPSIEDWLRAASRSEEDIATVKRVRAELQAMAIHGYENTVEFVSVNRVIQTVNWLPCGVWKAQQDAYDADVARFLQ